MEVAEIADKKSRLEQEREGLHAERRELALAATQGNKQAQTRLAAIRQKITELSVEISDLAEAEGLQHEHDERSRQAAIQQMIAQRVSAIPALLSARVDSAAAIDQSLLALRTSISAHMQVTYEAKAAVNEIQRLRGVDASPDIFWETPSVEEVVGALPARRFGSEDAAKSNKVLALIRYRGH